MLIQKALKLNIKRLILSKITLLVLFIIHSSTMLAQHKMVQMDSVHTLLIENFLTAIADHELATDIIISQYIEVNKPSDDIYDYLEASIDEIRLNINAENVHELNLIPYQKTPKAETKDIDLEDKDSSNVYFIKNKDRLVLALLMNKKNIASITLVSKGNKKAHFVTY